MTPTPPYEDGSLWQMDGDTAVYTFLGQTKYWIHPQDLADMLAAGAVHNPIHCATAHSLDGISNIPQDKTLIEEFGSFDIYVVDCSGKFLTPTLGVAISMLSSGYATALYIIPPGESQHISDQPDNGCPLRETTGGPNYVTCKGPARKWAMSAYAQTRLGHVANMMTLWPAGQGYPGALEGFTTLAQTALKSCPDIDNDGWSDLSEFFMGTSELGKCAADTILNNEPLPDRWPVDFDDNQWAQTPDLLHFSFPVFNSTAPGPPYDPRVDLNTDDRVNMSDVLLFSDQFNQSCAP